MLHGQNNTKKRGRTYRHKAGEEGNKAKKKKERSQLSIISAVVAVAVALPPPVKLTENKQSTSYHSPWWVFRTIIVIVVAHAPLIRLEMLPHDLPSIHPCRFCIQFYILYSPISTAAPPLPVPPVSLGCCSLGVLRCEA